MLGLSSAGTSGPYSVVLRFPAVLGINLKSLHMQGLSHTFYLIKNRINWGMERIAMREQNSGGAALRLSVPFVQMSMISGKFDPTAIWDELLFMS